MNREMIAALHSLKSDAAYAWSQALEGDLAPLHRLGESMKRVERLVMEEDARQSIRRRDGA